MKKTLYAILLVASVSSCAKDHAGPFPDSSCDTTSLTYNLQIAPIFNQHCISCHDSLGTTAGDFTSYVGIKAYVDSGNMWNRTVVVGDMPPSGPLISCDLDQLKAWINNGAPEN